MAHCEQKIMELLLPQPLKAYSVRQINKIIKSSYALTHKSINTLAQKGVIVTEKMGNSLLCHFNLSADPQATAVFSQLQAQQFLQEAKFGFLIDEIKTKLSDSLYIMVLFGSYAKGMATKDSDLDLLFVIQNESDIEKIRKKINAVLSTTKIKIEFEVITVEWLLKMFAEKQSVGREVLEGSIALHGAEQYYTLVRKYDQERGH